MRFRSPLYHQIFLLLRQRIVDGALEPGAIVPGEQDLAEQFKVSRITANRALDELAAAGLVVRERGRGTRVLGNGDVAPVSTDMDEGMGPLIAMGGQTKARVIEIEEITADPSLAGRLEIDSGALVQRTVRVRTSEGAAFSHLTTFVPSWVGQFTKKALETTPLLVLFQQAGVKPVSATQTMAATLADGRVAERLEVDIGAPLLRVERIVRDGRDRVIELLSALYRTDRYRLSMTLSRGDAAEQADWKADAVASSPSEDAIGWLATRAGGTG